MKNTPEKYKEYFSKFMEYLRLRTKPVAVSLIEEDIDKVSLPIFRPKRDFHRRFTFCQMAAASRYYGWAVGASLEDMSCPGEMMIFGFVKAPDYFLDGSLSYGLYTETKEDGRKLDEGIPTLPYGKYKGLITSSLEYPATDPNVIMIYGTPGQMVKLVTAYVFKTGEEVHLTSSGKAGSCTGVVNTILSDKPRLVLPGLGDRIVGHTEDYEMLFTIPMNWIEKIIDGMEKQSSSNFIVYPPMPHIFYKASFKTIPIIGGVYDRFLKELRGDSK